MSVSELLASHSSRELAEWQAYFALEPTPDQLTQVMIAQLTALIHNMLSKEKKSSEDFMPRLEDKSEADLEAQIKMRFGNRG